IRRSHQAQAHRSHRAVIGSEIPQSSCRNSFRPSYIFFSPSSSRVLTVPNGVFVFAAISRWLIPWKNASSTACCCGGGKESITFRMSWRVSPRRSEEHTSELQSRGHLVCRL